MFFFFFFGRIFSGTTLKLHGLIIGEKPPRPVKVDVVFRPDKAEPYESLSLGKQVMERHGTLDKAWKKPWKNNIKKKKREKHGQNLPGFMIWR